MNMNTRMVVQFLAGKASVCAKVLLFLALVSNLAGCASRESTNRSTAADAGARGQTASTETAKPPPASPAESGAAETSMSLFDGKTLEGWKISDFAGTGEVKVEGGKIVLGMGLMTGVTWTNDLPRTNYEVSLEAMRVDGSDFFCALTFPVGKEPCTLVVGGWGGGVVGLSSLDGEDAANNETSHYMNFQNSQWYKIRLRVQPPKIQAWIDNEKVVDLDITDRRLSIRWECEPSLPFGIATWSTTGAARNIQIRRL